MNTVIENFLLVAQQVLILFVLIAVGFVLGKRGVIGAGRARLLADIALLVATPCVIVRSFASIPATRLPELGLAVGVCFLIHGVFIALAHLIFRGKTSTAKVLRLSAVLSNAGFMALPLQEAVLGTDGVFFGSAFVAVFNLILWTYGLAVMDKEGGGFNLKKLLFNPGLIGLVGGIIVMLLPTELPAVVAQPINHLANLNTPLPMLFIGYYLSTVDFRKIIRRPAYFAASAVRLLLAPVVAGAVMYAVGVRGALFVSLMIAACAPVATSVTMFAARYNQDNETAVNTVAVSTLLSLVTMPVLVALAQWLP